MVPFLLPIHLCEFQPVHKINPTMHHQVEIKNLNSFSAISRAIDFEISRQVLLHNENQSIQIVQETRLWDEGAQVTVTSCLYDSITQ